ncbi:aminopeptidase [Flammeovirga sp. MY04]|uniref:aminopeptidase n=1 Tax=Flammeovirga sp. MY04 TaxID=1191459 RepID=UPI000806377C|nr:aminopeptidase [Flammeovirga sp. MY04]ANQ50519.1 aminopeptidase [Flammeovirga sp. MY04]
MIKKIFLGILFFLLLFLGYYHEEALYGIRQGKGQLQIIFDAKPLSSYLEDPEISEKQKAKIHLIQEIRQFTIDSLGLDYTESYTKMYDQKGEPILWNVTACKPFELTPKRWSFPIAGSFPYKGYFIKDLATTERDELRKESWDAEVREVSAWSTLGVLNDPILSSMLERSTGSLAQLVIHELTHGTLYVKGSITYNENLADFVGDEGAKRFLIYKYGKYSEEYIKFMARSGDRKTFSEYILKSTNSLDSLYQTFTDQMSVEEKQQLKDQKIKEITEGLQHLSFSNYNYCTYFDDFTPNNTFFMSYKRYRSKQNEFKQEFEEDFHGDFHAYMDYLKEEYKPMFKYLKKMF